MKFDFSNFCSSNGIIHQTFCAYTLQQNGVVEHKNKHFLEVAHTIMLQMTVPKSFWHDVVLTVGFLINRIPSSAFGGDIHFKCLFPDSPFFLLLVFFGVCALFIFLTPEWISFLLELFVVFSWDILELKKGYKCYDPVAKRNLFMQMSPFLSLNRFSKFLLTNCLFLFLLRVYIYSTFKTLAGLHWAKSFSNPLCSRAISYSNGFCW